MCWISRELLQSYVLRSMRSDSESKLRLELRMEGDVEIRSKPPCRVKRANEFYCEGE